jgi:hypothetical protein
LPGRFRYIETAENAGLTYRSADRLFLIGGDDFDQAEGGGGYKNDVWYTPGLNWTVVRSYVNVDE